MNFKLISCEIFFREFEFLLERSPHAIDVEFMPKGLHDIPHQEMIKRLQAQIDNASNGPFDALLLGYGLCNNGLDGLRARKIPLVLPRAHDCITLFLGSRERYQDYFTANPGTFFKTTGWIERDEVSEELKPLSIPHRMGMAMRYEELVEKYGEDNAQFLWDELCNTEKNYSQITFIEMGVEPDDRFEQLARKEAENKEWAFEKISGSLNLLEKLLGGQWDPVDFLIVPPGHHIAASPGQNIVTHAL